MMWALSNLDILNNIQWKIFRLLLVEGDTEDEELEIEEAWIDADYFVHSHQTFNLEVRLIFFQNPAHDPPTRVILSELIKQISDQCDSAWMKAKSRRWLSL